MSMVIRESANDDPAPRVFEMSRATIQTRQNGREPN